MNSDKYLKYFIAKIGKLGTFLKKIKSKRARDNELREKLKKARLHSSESINAAIKKIKSDKSYLKQVDEFNKQYLGGYKNRDWNIFLSVISERKSKKYIPESVFINHIEPRLNDLSQTSGIMEKNIYDLIFHDLRRPETVIRFINGAYYNFSYDSVSKREAEEILNGIDKPLIVKPSFHGQGQGRNMKSFRAGDSIELLNFLSQSRSEVSNFVVQQWIDQHQTLSNIYPGSVNTLKILTLRVNDEIEYLMARLNIGKKNSFIDKGGYFAGVDNDGVIRSSAIDTDNFSKCGIHEDSGIPFRDLKIPSFHKAIEMCKKAHQRLLHFDMVSWDVAIDSEEMPVLIEMNLKSQDVKFNQLASGPLFGEHTEDILGKMNINLHFNI